MVVVSRVVFRVYIEANCDVLLDLADSLTPHDIRGGFTSGLFGKGVLPAFPSVPM